MAILSSVPHVPSVLSGLPMLTSANWCIFYYSANSKTSVYVECTAIDLDLHMSYQSPGIVKEVGWHKWLICMHDFRSELLKHRNVVSDLTGRWSDYIPDSKVHGAKIGPTWGRQVGPMWATWTFLSGMSSKSLTAKKFMEKVYFCRQHYPCLWPSTILDVIFVNYYSDVIMSAMVSHHWNDNTYSLPTFNSAAIGFWKRMNNFIPHFTGHVIIIHHRAKVNT